MGFLGIRLVLSDKPPVVGNPRGHTLVSICSLSPDNVLAFVGNRARFHRIACSFSADYVLAFNRNACSFSPDTLLVFSRCTQSTATWMSPIASVRNIALANGSYDSQTPLNRPASGKIRHRRPTEPAISTKFGKVSSGFGDPAKRIQNPAVEDLRPPNPVGCLASRKCQRSRSFKVVGTGVLRKFLRNSQLKNGVRRLLL